jgi:hypothetical protein
MIMTADDVGYDYDEPPLSSLIWIAPFSHQQRRIVVTKDIKSKPANRK